MSMTGQINLTGSITPSKDIGLITGIAASVAMSFKQAFTDGTGAGNLHQGIAMANAALAASATDTYHLNDGVAKDQYGDLLAVTKLRLLVVLNLSTDPTNILNVKSTTGFVINSTAAASIPVPPGGCLVLVGPSAAGFAAVGSSDGGITVANASGSVVASYQIFAAGSN